MYYYYCGELLFPNSKSLHCSVHTFVHMYAVCGEMDNAYVSIEVQKISSRGIIHKAEKQD